MLKDHPRIVEYFQGACIANAPTLLLFVVLSFLDQGLDFLAVPLSFLGITLPLLSILAFLVILVSTIIAGFLVAGRITSHYIRTGIITGALSFPLFLVYSILFYPSGVLPEVWALIFFLVGGSLGGLLRRYLYY